MCKLRPIAESSGNAHRLTIDALRVSIATLHEGEIAEQALGRRNSAQNTNLLAEIEAALKLGTCSHTITFQQRDFAEKVVTLRDHGGLVRRLQESEPLCYRSPRPGEIVAVACQQPADIQRVREPASKTERLGLGDNGIIQGRCFV